MKSKTFYVYILVFCSSIFSFATVMLPYPMTVFDWIRTLTVQLTAAIVAVLLISDNRKTKPLADLISLLYIFILIARSLNRMNVYMKTYHRQTSSAGNILITALTVIMLSYFSDEKTEKLTLPVSVAVMLMLIMVAGLNVTKIAPVNLYGIKNNTEVIYTGVTLFDFIVPANIILNSSKKAKRRKAVFTFLSIVFLMILITTLVFSCVSGDLLYSLSPLQMAFQISSGFGTVNFDAVFNLLLWFGYFSALMLLMNAYSCIKKRFSYFNRSDLLMIFPLFLLIDKIDNSLWLPLMLSVSIVLCIGRRKTGYYEKA